MSFDALGNACIIAGAPAIVAVEFADQDLSGRTFVYSVWEGPGRAVVGDWAFGDPVVEGDRTVIKAGPDGSETAALSTGPTGRRSWHWAVIERTGDGDVYWIGPRRWVLQGERDPSVDYPDDAGPALDGPYAVIEVAGPAGDPVFVVSSVGAPGPAGEPGTSAPVPSYATGSHLLALGASTLTVSEPVDVAGKVEVYRGGLRLWPGDDYTADGSDTLTLIYPVDDPAGELFRWRHSGA